mmetsp:Transcript_109014/g.351848  ORF Transcript_109014/g.351848 Transcript_109014/m.351848 type:complete len:217 (-) Transcript_109014:238-888(-)
MPSWRPPPRSACPPTSSSLRVARPSSRARACPTTRASCRPPSWAPAPARTTYATWRRPTASRCSCTRTIARRSCCRGSTACSSTTSTSSASRASRCSRATCWTCLKSLMRRTSAFAQYTWRGWRRLTASLRWRLASLAAWKTALTTPASRRTSSIPLRRRSGRCTRLSRPSQKSLRSPPLSAMSTVCTRLGMLCSAQSCWAHSRTTPGRYCRAANP